MAQPLQARSPLRAGRRGSLGVLSVEPGRGRRLRSAETISGAALKIAILRETLPQLGTRGE